jgi:hypothetical protein
VTLCRGSHRRHVRQRKVDPPHRVRTTGHRVGAEDPASESDMAPAGALCADRLNAVEEVVDPTGKKRSGLGVIGRQRTVGEVVLIAGVEE